MNKEVIKEKIIISARDNKSLDLYRCRRTYILKNTINSHLS